MWFDIPHRPTRDVDFLGIGPAGLPHLEGVFKEVCAIDTNDGVSFRTDTVQADEIRKEVNYAGVRITMLGLIDGARCPIQVDVGFGDAVTPGPEDVLYPVMLPEFEAPRLRVYPRYTVVAEKLEALTSLGIANSRMKDYFDLWVLSRHTNFDGDTLRRAIQATFNRRKTALPTDTPFGLSDGFAQDAQKQTQWRAFLRKNGLEALTLDDVVVTLRDFLLPVILAANTDAHHASQADLIASRALPRFLPLNAFSSSIEAASPRSSRNTVTSISSENRLIRPNPLESDVPPLNNKRGLSASPLKSASSVQHTQKSFSTFWGVVPRRWAVVVKRPSLVSSSAAMI